MLSAGQRQCTVSDYVWTGLRTWAKRHLQNCLQSGVGWIGFRSKHIVNGETLLGWQVHGASHIDERGRTIPADVVDFEVNGDPDAIDDVLRRENLTVDSTFF